MIYLVRLRLKDSVTAVDIPAINKDLDEVSLPALVKSDGVRAAQAYRTDRGGIVVIIDIENLTALEQMLAARELEGAIAPLLQWTVRDGPDVILYDREA